MIGLIGRLTAQISRLSTAARLAWLNGALVVVLLASATVASLHGGAASLAAVLIAAVVCAACANVALVLATLWHGSPNGVSGALAGSLVGMFPPLVIGCALHLRGGELAQAGILNWTFVFYLAALIVKTLLVAPLTATTTVRPTTSTTSKAGA